MVPTNLKTSENVRRSTPASGAVGAMSPFHHQIPRHRCPLLLGNDMSTVSDPLSVAADQEVPLRPTTAEADPSLHPTRATNAAVNVRRTMYGAGTRRGGFIDSVERANICAVRAQTSDASGAATPYVGRCELVPTTAVLANARPKYPVHSRAAYGRRHLRASAPRCSSSTKSRAPRTDPSRDADLSLTVTSVAEPRYPDHQTTTSFPTNSPRRQSCAEYAASLSASAAAPGKLDAPRYRTAHEHGPYTGVAARGLEGSLRGIFEYLPVQCQVRNRTAQPLVHSLKLIKPPAPIPAGPAILPAPTVQGDLADPELSHRARHRHALAAQHLSLATKWPHGLLGVVELRRHHRSSSFHNLRVNEFNEAESANLWKVDVPHKFLTLTDSN